MPYVSQADREIAVRAMESGDVDTLSAGQLNMILTSAVALWLGKAPNYTRFNAAIGVLECAKLELYRRMVAPYEDTKLAENGDVYITKESK